MDFWGHNNLFQIFRLKKNLKFGLSPVRKMYIACALLHNARTSVYGNTASTYFDCESLKLSNIWDNYLSMKS